MKILYSFVLLLLAFSLAKGQNYTFVNSSSYDLVLYLHYPEQVPENAATTVALPKGASYTFTNVIAPISLAYGNLVVIKDHPGYFEMGNRPFHANSGTYTFIDLHPQLPHHPDQTPPSHPHTTSTLSERDLYFIKTGNTGIGKVEVHVASQQSNYQTRSLETGTFFAAETDGTWFMADYTHGPDLVLIKTNHTTSGKVEVRVASQTSNYQTKVFDTPCAFAPEMDGTWLMGHYSGKVPDLVFIKTSNTPSGKVEIHIASAQSNYQTRILDTVTSFAAETDGTWLMPYFTVITTH